MVKNEPTHPNTMRKMVLNRKYAGWETSKPTKYKNAMTTSTKLIDKINSVLTSEKDQNKTFYSFEYFPPRTEQGNIRNERAGLNYVYRC